MKNTAAKCILAGTYVLLPTLAVLSFVVANLGSAPIDTPSYALLLAPTFLLYPAHNALGCIACRSPRPFAAYQAFCTLADLVSLVFLASRAATRFVVPLMAWIVLLRAGSWLFCLYRRN